MPTLELSAKHRSLLVRLSKTPTGSACLREKRFLNLIPELVKLGLVKGSPLGGFFYLSPTGWLKSQEKL